MSDSESKLGEVPTGDRRAFWPRPCGPREWEEPPEIGTQYWETIEDRRLHLEIAAFQQLPVVPGGTFKHDEVWIVCRILTG